MITVTEIRRLADVLEVGPPVVDHDYVLGCFLHYLALQPEVQEGWIFKGGTALRKCYFADYRFSEDLDFTAIKAVSAVAMQNVINHAKHKMQEALGIKTDKHDAEVEAIADDYGEESFEAKIYYEGPWQYGGTPRSLRIHVNRDEQLLFPPRTLPIIHAYSDDQELVKTSLRVYALEEVFAEKLRAFSGQRKWAIARDVYDLHMLSKSSVNIEAALQAFPQKCSAKGIALSQLDVAKVEWRRREYENNWRNNLEYLVPTKAKAVFEEAWNTALEFLARGLRGV